MDRCHRDDDGAHDDHGHPPHGHTHANDRIQSWNIGDKVGVPKNRLMRPSERRVLDQESQVGGM